MSRSANQPVCVGTRPSTSSRRHQRKPSPAEASRYFSTPQARKSTPELPHVERQRADRLVGVQQHECAPLARDPHDLPHVEPRAVAIADVRHRHERRPLVDDPLELLEVERRAHVDDLRAAPLLRVPDLPDRRELVVGDDDPPPLAVQPQPAGERAHALRERGRHGNLRRALRPRGRRTTRVPPRCARPRAPTASRARPSRRDSARRSRAPRPRARPASSC